MKLLSNTGGTQERGIELPLLNVVLPSGVQFPNHHCGLTQGLNVYSSPTGSKWFDSDLLLLLNTVHI